MAAAPQAHADGLDVIIDPIINSILSSMTDSVTGLDALLGFDPTAGLDLALPATDVATAADLGGLALPATDAVAASDPVAAATAAADPAASTSLADLYNSLVYDPSHTWDQQWIDGTTFLGNLTVQFDNFVNSLDPGTLLIGNGADGIDGGTLAQADGAAGGLWFGDGGSGGTDLAGQGGDGGAAFDGNGGLGGGGGTGAYGGDGGAGGNGADGADG
jgi:hypothetical protein